MSSSEDEGFYAEKEDVEPKQEEKVIITKKELKKKHKKIKKKKDKLRTNISNLDLNSESDKKEKLLKLG